MQGRIGAPPLTHLRGVLDKPETRSAEAGATIASRRNAAWAAESWDLGLPIALPRGSALFVKNLHSGDVLRQAPVRDDQTRVFSLPCGQNGIPSGRCRETFAARAINE